MALLTIAACGANSNTAAPATTVAPSTTVAAVTTTEWPPVTTHQWGSSQVSSYDPSSSTASATQASACLSAWQSLLNVYDTLDNDLFDRRYNATLDKCVNYKTWNDQAGVAGAPSGATKMLTAACMLYGSNPVCRDR